MTDVCVCDGRRVQGPGAGVQGIVVVRWWFKDLRGPSRRHGGSVIVRSLQSWWGRVSVFGLHGWDRSSASGDTQRQCQFQFGRNDEGDAGADGDKGDGLGVQ